MEPLAAFLQSILTEHAVLVDRTTTFTPDATTRNAWYLLEETLQINLPGEAPEAEIDVGLWAAERLYFACQAVVCRDLETAEIRPLMMKPCPVPRGPMTDYSADVCLRFLPEVIKLAKRLSAGDEVVVLLRDFIAQWPLSAVGLEVSPLPNVETFWQNETLRRLFVDRVIAHKAVETLQIPEVATAVQSALGIHENLAPEIAAALRGSTL